MNSFLFSRYGLDIAQEALAVQTNSKLGKRLEKMFTECFKIKDTEYTDDISEKNLLKLTEKISKYIISELPKIINEESKIFVSKVYCNNDYPDGDIMIDYITTFDFDAVMARDLSLTGYSTNTASITDYSKRVKDILDITKTYNSNTGRLSKSFPIKLWFDTSMMFFIQKYFQNTESFTAEECTAIMLHELGHISTFLERSPIDYYVAKTVDDNINKIISVKNKSLDDHRVIIDNVLIPISTKLDKYSDKTVTTENTKFKEFISKISTLVEFLISKRDGIVVNYNKTYSDMTMRNSLSKSIGDIKNYVLEVLSSIVAIVLGLLLKAVLVVLLYGIFKELLIELCLYTDNSKTSDIKTTQHNVYLQERLADEFVVRHGYSKAMATSLNKFMKLSSGYYDKDMIIKDSKLLAVLDKVLAKISNTNCGSGSYEEDVQRIRRIAQATIGVLKDSKINPEFRNTQLDSLKNTLKILDENHAKLYKNQSLESVIKILTTLISVDDWIRILTSGRLTQEYERQLNQIDDLINNSMYAHSADLKRISESVK